MRRRNLGQVLMAAGVACGLFYILTSLYARTAILRPLSTMLLLLGIAAIVAGLVLYGTSTTSRR